MSFILIGGAIAIVAFVAWESTRLVRDRDAAARRRVRMNQRTARQKAWDLVFGRRTQKRLSFDPTKHVGD